MQIWYHSFVRYQILASIRTLLYSKSESGMCVTEMVIFVFFLSVNNATVVKTAATSSISALLLAALVLIWGAINFIWDARNFIWGARNFHSDAYAKKRPHQKSGLDLRCQILDHVSWLSKDTVSVNTCKRYCQSANH